MLIKELTLDTPVSLQVFLAVGAVLAVIVYRMSVFAVPSLNRAATSSSHPAVFSSVTASIINLICITIFNMVSRTDGRAQLPCVLPELFKLSFLFLSEENVLPLLLLQQ